jgi:riboflavin synthase
MFTGIIESIGKIKKINQHKILVSNSLDGVKVGDSISVNGICLTVSEIDKTNKSYDCLFNISPETYSRTNLRYLKIGDNVNLERALRIDSRLDGHIVTGHIDDCVKVLSIKKVSDSYEFEFSIPENLNKFIAEKGSVALDGISLTVAKKKSKSFVVAIVPFTFNHTNLQWRKVGDYLNLEVDILARYVESILSGNESNSKLKNLIGEKW